MMYIKSSIWPGFEFKNWIKPKIGRDLNSPKMHFCYKFGNCNFNWWWVMACTSSKWGKFWLWSSIWPWRSLSIIPQNNRALNQGLLHLWTKFGDPRLNSWWVIVQTNSWLTDTHTHTHTQATTIPEGQNWPRVKTATKYNNFYWRKLFWKCRLQTGCHFASRYQCVEH